MRRLITLSIAASAFAGAAVADTAYVKPSDFTPQLDQTITVEVSFSDYCCEPRYAVRTQTYEVIDPDGVSSRPDRIEILATATMLEQTIDTNGTTRISTGERLGRKGEYVLLDETYYLVNSPDAELMDIPPGTPVLSSQTATVSDAYVTVGMQDWGAIRSKIGRLALTPAIHPSSVQAGSPFIARITFDGEPLTEQDVVLTNETQRLYQQGETLAQTDGDGIVTITFDQPGTHVIMTRHRATAPDGAETDIRSYTTALTLSVAPE